MRYRYSHRTFLPTYTLEINNNLVRCDLTTVVQRIKGIGKGSSTASTAKSLSAFTDLAMLVRDRVVTKGTVHQL